MSDILIVDDEPSVSWAYAKSVRGMGHTGHVAATAEAALDLMAGRKFDLALLDLQLPGIDGLTALDRFATIDSRMPVIVLTAHSTPEATVEATRRGALEYLLKPVDLEDLQRAVRWGLDAAMVRRAEAAALANPSAGANGATGTGSAGASSAGASTLLVGRCPGMQEVYKRIGLASGGELPVLIEGETGTGKELVSQSIHRHSARSGGPFVVVNCACLPAELLESELFGHTKGAFTGAVADKPGQVELAHGGTLFLDEVGELPPTMQAGLLRFAESKRAVRVGGRVPYEVDVRIIAATNRRLRLEVEEGRFRRDLYYRLNALTVQLPALRDRGEDIHLLIEHFLRTGAGRSGLPPATITAEARLQLVSHSWPGNVRELRNAVEHAVLLSRGGPVRVEHLPDTMTEVADVAGDDMRGRLERLADQLLAARIEAGDEAALRYEALIAEFERPLLESAMRRFGGNQAKLAGAVKLHRTTLRERLRRYGLIDPSPGAGDEE